MSSRKIIEIRHEAENAVSEMPDGELKVKAFEVILNHLLRTQDRAPNGEGTTLPTATQHDKKQRLKQVGTATSKTNRILLLKSEDYFRELRTIGEVREELTSRGWHYPMTALSGPLQELVQRRELRRQKMLDGKKRVWKYSNP